MSWSLGEIRALSVKAARGSSMDWGMAECPLKLGCMVSDMNNWELLEGKECHEPVLLIPFIANVVKDASISLSWAEINALINGNGVKIDDIEILVSRPSSSKQSLHIKLHDAPCEVLSYKTRVSEGEASYVAILNALAHKVYAPATEASRLSGAGAGLNDND